MSTLADSRRRTSERPVKSGSGFLQAWRARNTAPIDEGDEPFAPDAQSRWVLDAVKADLRGELTKVVAALSQHKRTVASPTDLDGSHPAYLLRHLAMLALDLEIDPKATFESSVNRLQWAWDMLNERAAEQAALERHSPVNAAEAAADGALLASSARRGKESERGPVVAAEIVDRAAKAPFPTQLQEALTPERLKELDAERAAQVERTAVLPVIESVTVAAPVSPVHAHDGIAPAIPAEDEIADPGAAKPVPLPRRIPQASTHPVLPADLDLDPYEAVDPTIEGAGLVSGAWVFDEGTGTGGPVWFLLAEQRDELREDGRVAVLRFANEASRDVYPGTQVKVLDVRRAQVLVAQIEQRLAARDAEQEASS